MRKLAVLLTVVFALSQLTGCMLMGLSRKASEPGKGARVPEKKVAVIGKISYPPELKQEFKPGSMADKLWGKKMDIMFGRESKGKGKLDAFTEIKWDEYFVLLLPRNETFLMATKTYISTDLKGNTFLQVMWRQKIAVEPEDRAIYIGDITIQFNVPNTLGGKDNLIVIADRFEDAERVFAEYQLLDESSSPVKLSKRLATGDKKAEATMFIESLRAY